MPQEAMTIRVARPEDRDTLLSHWPASVRVTHTFLTERALLPVVRERARRLKRRLMVDINEQNPDGVRFYKRLGFAVVGRSETDSDGRPFPLLPMKEMGIKK